MTMRALAGIDQFLLAQNYPPETHRWYQQKLYDFGDFLEKQGISFEEITHRHIADYLKILQGRTSVQYDRPLSTKTMHGYLRSIKALLRWAYMEEYITVDVARKMRMPKQDDTLVEILSTDDVDRLMKACRKEPGWLCERNRTILSVLLTTGIRNSELTGLKVDDATIGLADSHLLVFGKGRKSRLVPLARQCQGQLFRYIHKVRPKEFISPWLFPSRRGSRLTVQGLDKVLYRLQDYAGLEDRDIRAHVFRHTFSVRFMEQGGDVAVLSRILGHTTLSVTAEYLKQFTSIQAGPLARPTLDSLEAIYRRHGR